PDKPSKSLRRLFMETARLRADLSSVRFNAALAKSQGDLEAFNHFAYEAVLIEVTLNLIERVTAA
ncbi:MAG TPA: hypothetical protein VHE77_05060, partial [Dongiaceae bacterium]|nr:hypothetical protein [Dongiaceae bacterium]